MAESNDQNKEKIDLAKTSHAEREERVLAYWKSKKIFEKSLEMPAGSAPKGEFTFYDGPPFATGSPHYGHILAGTIKDVIPRWKTMQGYHVDRRWGWDCHGLPVENLVEKELGLKNKKDIIDYGIERFNEAARNSVMRYAHEWREIIPRLGRFVDMDNDYRTLDATYTESVWWIFKSLYDKGLIYEGFKSMNLCPHCETTLSNFEVAQGYKDITDISVYVKFKLVGNEAGVGTSRKSENKAGDKIGGGAENGAETFLLAWTTTPWTLPGNVALAINPKIEYVKIRITEGDEQKKGLFILAKERLAVLKDIKYEIVETMAGSKLVGLSYEPMFDYYSKDKDLKNTENGWKIYPADFVTTEDGTGVVHIAPAFGVDDYELLKINSLPFVQHVSVDGMFKKEVTDFPLMSVKPKDTDQDKNAHQKADIEVIKWLAHHGFLFEKEKLVHSYPHCWRCDTPLLNYATSSWFVKVTDIKDDLVKENQKITWVPPEVGGARFGNWLEGARDWAISRTRFWGAPIPVWKEEVQKDLADGKTNGSTKYNYHVIGSVSDLKKFSKAKNTYYIMRHGQAQNNVDGVLCGKADSPTHLTDLGKEQAAKAALQLQGKKIDLIVVSPFMRTQETAEIVKKALLASNGGLDIPVITDDRIHELNGGVYDGKKVADFSKDFPFMDRFTKMPEGGETYSEIKKRMGGFLYDMEKKYEGKTILVVSHETALFLLVAAVSGLDHKQSLELRGDKDFIANAEVRKLDFSPLPHNAEYELDLHRPFIDDIELKTETGNKLTRVVDVFDCWFESGSMPYGKSHYPFEKNAHGKECGKDGFDPTSGLLHKSQGFPADFIAEGLDQTRGWFYSMLVLGVALFGKSPYKKVIVNGLVLAEDGEKMSKSKKNYPDPMLLVNKYGADSIRLYMMTSPVVHGEDLCFSEKGVDEITKKIVNRLLNVLSFYEMYKDNTGNKAVSQNVLDKWMVARLNETIAAISDGLEKGELDRASRPFLDFIDDFSTWYIRRSRDRFKGDDSADKEAALRTTGFVLNETAKLLAPFMPFLADEIYMRIGGEKESVHLESWPAIERIDSHLLASMKSVREIASKGLEARMIAKLNVRQPLKTLKVKALGLDGNSTAYSLAKSSDEFESQFIELIKDEVNVKEVLFGASIESEVELDVTITPELKEEGNLRELMRKIQDLRKDKGLSVGDMAVLIATEDFRSLISKYEEMLKKATKLESIEYGGVFEIKKK